MEKSLALVLPDRPGMLREVMRVLSSHNVSVLRLSYNRVIDMHTMFLDVTGTIAALADAEDELRAWRFFPGQRDVGEVRLFELKLGSDSKDLMPVLEVFEQNEINVTYVDLRTDGSSNGITRIAAYLKRSEQLDALVQRTRKHCDVNVVPKGEQPDMLDNNHFNLSFAHGLAKRLGLDAQDEEVILINSNRIMQNLMKDGSDPYKPFDFINQIAEAMATYRDDVFVDACRVSTFTTDGGLVVRSIEPPLGCTTWVLECDDCLLCIDAGYRRFAGELERMLRTLYPDWDLRTKKLVLTHADFDHTGAYDLFDKIYASGRVIDNFSFESLGIVNWREQNPKSLPYSFIGNVLSQYKTPPFESIHCLGDKSPMGEQPELLRHIDTLCVPPLSLEVWEGKGGHVRGEVILVEREHRLCVSGDLFVNVHGQTKPQARFNALGPYLMTSVDSNPKLALEERKAMFGLLDAGDWKVLCGHGPAFDWSAQG